MQYLNVKMSGSERIQPVSLFFCFQCIQHFLIRRMFRKHHKIQIQSLHLKPLKVTGLKINKKIQSQFCNKIPKFSRNLATFSCRILGLHFLVSGLAKQNMSRQYLCMKKSLKMVNDRKNATVPVFNGMFERSNIAAKLHHN